MSNVTPMVRIAGQDDLQAIAAIAEQAFKAAYHTILPPQQLAFDLDRGYSLKALYQQWTEQRHVFWVVEESNQVILGFASASPNELTDGRLYVHKLYLHPACKGQGLGALLITALQQYAVAQGFNQVELTVNRSNPAVGFYHRCGFVIERELDTCIGPNYWRNDYVMVWTAATLPSWE